LDEVFEMSDRITVLRDGRSVKTANAADITKDEIIAAMVGREVGDIFPTRRHELGDTAMSVANLTATDTDTGRKLVDDISFSVRKGEVLGIAGLMGSGRSELLMSIFGAFPGRVSGTVEIEGRR